MSRRLDLPHARYDARFYADDKYLALPKAIRQAAYNFLLAINGWSRENHTDSEIPIPIARGLAVTMEVPYGRCVEALAEQHLVAEHAGTLNLTRYGKWQQTTADLAEISGKRAAAGQKGALSRWQSASPPNGKPGSNLHSKGMATPMANAMAIAPEEEEEEEEKELIPPDPPLATPMANAMPEGGSEDPHDQNEVIEGEVQERAQALEAWARKAGRFKLLHGSQRRTLTAVARLELPAADIIAYVEHVDSKLTEPVARWELVWPDLQQMENKHRKRRSQAHVDSGFTAIGGGSR